MHISIFFRIFAIVKEITINPIYSPSKTQEIMNKTVRILLKALGYFVAALLGAAGEATLM